MSRKSELNSDIASIICQSLISIGDHIYGIKNSLESFGFAAHNARTRFDESFASSELDVELHRRIEVELAKDRLGTPDDMSFPPPRSIYSSELLQRLALARDAANGCSLADVGKLYPGERWREEIDPCSRRRWYLALRERSELDRLEALYEEERRHLFARDVDRYRTGLSVRHGWSLDRRFLFYAEAMAEVFGSFGFVIAPEKLTNCLPILIKKVNDSWSIALVADGSLNRKDRDAYFDLSVFFYPSRWTSFRPRIGNILHVKHEIIVPGFHNGYLVVNDLDELETAIRAKGLLYSILAPAFETALAGVADWNGS